MELARLNRLLPVVQAFTLIISDRTQTWSGARASSHATLLHLVNAAWSFSPLRSFVPTLGIVEIVAGEASTSKPCLFGGPPSH